MVFRCPPYFEHSCCPPPPGFGGVRNYWGARQPDAEPAGSERFPQRHLPLTGQPEAFPSDGSAFQNLAGAWDFGVKIGQKLLRQAHSCQDCNLLYLKYVILMSSGHASQTFGLPPKVGPNLLADPPPLVWGGGVLNYWGATKYQSQPRRRAQGIRGWEGVLQRPWARKSEL